MRVLMFCLSLMAVISVSSASEMEWVKLSSDQRKFISAESGAVFRPWGFNYDHDAQGRLIEDYWDQEWSAVESDFSEMKKLGANVVRVHLQFGKFMVSPREPNSQALERLKKLLRLAEEQGLYLNLTGLGCYHKEDVPGWYDQLSEQERWAAQASFWSNVAKTCSGSPSVFCYDLMNEPVVAGGNQPRKDWLGPGFGGKHFVQFITLDRGERDRTETARKWIRQLVAAIREQDQRHLITVGCVPWSLDRPGITSGFEPDQIAEELDFLCVHLYPERGKLNDAISILQEFSRCGKPVVVEEIFPLKCGISELDQFIHRVGPYSSGWFSFYWGEPPESLKSVETLPAKLMLGWLSFFQQHAADMVDSSLGGFTFLENGVTAHRGNSISFPENTMPALKSGIEVGADWIELDVFRTRDGKIVVIHDTTTGRTGDKNLTIADASYEELLTVDVATDFRKRMKLTQSEVPAAKIPTLEEVLLVAMKQNKTKVSIQPKVDCVADVIAIIRKLRAEGWVGFNDGNLQYMSEVKELAPELPVFWDRGPETNLAEDIAIAKEKGFESLVIHQNGITKERVQQVHAAGLKIGAWTVNDHQVMQQFLEIGLDRIYTDDPVTLLKLKTKSAQR